LCGTLYALFRYSLDRRREDPHRVITIINNNLAVAVLVIVVVAVWNLLESVE
jgi:hypothetical protein